MFGVLLAAIGLLGYWANQSGWWPATTEVKTVLSEGQRAVLGIDADDFHTSFVIAGREVFYGNAPASPVYNSQGQIVCWQSQAVRSVHGVNTDTIIYAGLTNNEVTLIMLPRDLFIGAGTRKINGVYYNDGPDALRTQVGDILGVPVDHYAVINLDIFQRLVDAVGGVELNVQNRMYHHDCTADLTIDIQPGVQVLDGMQASHFVRFRNTFRGDIDRVDNVKLFAYALLNRLKELSVGAVVRLPAIVSAVFDEVDTDVTLPFLLSDLLPRLSDLTITTAGTVPTVDAVRPGTTGLDVDAATVEAFLASTFGGEVRQFATAPEAVVLITDRTGESGRAEWFRSRMIAFGVPEELIDVRDASADPGSSRVVATVSHWDEADYYASLLGLSRQQIDRFPGDVVANIEIVLAAGSTLHGLSEHLGQ